ncbi:MAG: multiheme c-type cytochrome, partial [Myxococcota bacterium]|nr:multiheme c-type cytochrome [Myxococcota bacterium]
MERSTKVLYWLLVAVAVLGGYCFVGTVWWPLYFEALTLHLWLGLALTVLTVPATAWHVRQTRSSILKTLLLPAAVMAVLYLIIPGRPEFPAMGPIAWGAGLASLNLLLIAGVARLLPAPQRAPAATSISGVVLTVLCLWGIHVGFLGWLLRGDERWGPMLAHSAFGTFALVLVFPHLKRFRRMFRRRMGIPIALVLLAVLTWWWKVTYPHDLILADFQSPMDFRNEQLFANPLDRESRRLVTSPANATERQQDRHPALDEEAIGNSASCGLSGCHEILTRQWEGSAHRFAADNDLYRAVIKEFVAERGAAEAAFCANCHDPVRVFSGTVEEAYADGTPPPGDGVSCVVCHAVVDTPSVGNGVMTLRQPRAYPGRSPEQVQRNIRLDPRAHRQDLVSNFRMSNPTLSCASCHLLQLGPDMGATTTDTIQTAYQPASVGPDVLACTDCHMPTLTFDRSFEQAMYDHFLSGMGLDLGLYVSHPDADPEAIKLARENTVSFLAGTLDLEGLTGEKRIYEISDETMGVLRDSGAVGITLDARRLRADLLEVDVETSNHRSGHPFPIGPFDLNEVW